MIIKRYKVLTIVLAANFSCIEPYVPDIVDNETLLVVEGHISDLPAAYFVRLSSTQPLNAEGSKPETGARVWVTDEEGVEHIFEETAAGVYASDTACFVGQAGQTYRLNIVRSMGAVYQSDPVVLKSTPPIDSVYYERDVRFTDVEGLKHDGIKIMVDSHDPDGKTRYYRYEWTETYQIKVPYPVVYDDGVCYNSFDNTSIIATNTLHLDEDRVSMFEVAYVTTESYRLRSLYHVQVRQYALDEQGYHYWSELQKSSETLGSLFDPLPYSLTGNVRSADNPDEQVLGYFDASSVSAAAIYIDRKDLLELNYPPDGCYWELVQVYGAESPPQGYCLAIKGPFGSGYNIFAPAYCCYCDLYGYREVPDFWGN